jgi:hypothetical protein
MKTITFYLDFISPYAWLAFDALPKALQGISHRVVHKPLLFAALLKHHGQLGPAEMPSKRDWTNKAPLCSCRPHTHSTHWACCAWPVRAMRKGNPTDLCVKKSSDTCGARAWMRQIPNDWPGCTTNCHPI